MGYVNVYFFLVKSIQRNVLLNVGAVCDFDAPWSKQQGVRLKFLYSKLYFYLAFLFGPTNENEHALYESLSFLVSHLYFIILTDVNFKIL